MSYQSAPEVSAVLAAITEYTQHFVWRLVLFSLPFIIGIYVVALLIWLYKRKHKK